jgi:calcineurin-like phosphoesterase family protein
MKIKLELSQNIFFTSDTHYNHKNICRGVSNWKDINGNVPINQTRNFQSLEEMNDNIVNAINSKVKENDILFHLGDWSFGGINNIYEFRKKIKCKNIHLILGNHDHHIENNKQLMNLYKDEDTCEIKEGNWEENRYDEYKFGEYWSNEVYMRDLFSSVNQYLRLSISIYPGTTLYNGNHDFILSHYPIASWHNMNDGVMHLHGHVHLPEHLKIHEGKAMDVGCDGNNMVPYSINNIVSLLNNRPIKCLTLPQDHHEEKIEGNGGHKKGSSSF